MSYFLFADETNQQPTEKSRFFIYGGILIPAESLPELHELVNRARTEFGYRPRDKFKFNISDKPDHISHDQFLQAKKMVLEGSRPLGIKFISYLILHDIATSDLSELVRYGINTILGAFNRFLTIKNSTGIVILDRLPFGNGYQFLKDKFQVGLVFEDGIKPLDRIHLFSLACEGSSHAVSAVDIILGSFRYCVNEIEKDIAPKAMWPVIVDLMWHKRDGNKIILKDYGLHFRPRNIQVPFYQDQYDNLVDHLIGLLN